MYAVVGYNSWWLEWQETNLIPDRIFETFEEAQRAVNKLNQLHEEKFGISLEQRDSFKIRIAALIVITADDVVELSNHFDRS